MGLQPIVAPLFDIVPQAWVAPAPEEVDSVLLTSANAARHGGEGLTPFLTLPCYAVGEATAAAAAEAGFGTVVTGPSDGAAALEMLAAAGLERPLHPCGRDHVALEHPKLSVVRRIVYVAEEVEILPPRATAALEAGAVTLIHSPRAAARLGELLEREKIDRSKIPLAAISDAVAKAAGPGWSSVEVAASPRDDALLEVAAKLCKVGGSDTGKAE